MVVNQSKGVSALQWFGHYRQIVYLCQAPYVYRKGNKLPAL